MARSDETARASVGALRRRGRGCCRTEADRDGTEVSIALDGALGVEHALARCKRGEAEYTIIGEGHAVAGEFVLADQIVAQLTAVGVTIAWTGAVSAILFLALKYTIGLRPSAEVETEGLDINEHGERAYNY